jgi:hypothetical protein
MPAAGFQSASYETPNCNSPATLLKHRSRRLSFVRPKSRIIQALTLALSFSLSASAQNIAGSIKVTILDPNGTAISNASAELVNEATNVSVKTTSGPAGAVSFASVLTGDYRLTIEATGFDKHVTNGIRMTSGEIRDLGSINMKIGAITQSVSVTDTITPLQAASGERSGTVSGEQLRTLALKGRDFFALASLLPGVVDTSANGRDATSPNSLSGVIINGGRDEAKNFTVDGVSAVDTGGGNTVHYEPNMDSIAEVKILSANYQAEYGRNAGGTISVITKGGTMKYHASAWWTHRHEEFNANNFFNNATNLPRTRYRFNVEGYSGGGRVPAPKSWTKLHEKLFFFGSQEYTRQLVSFGAAYLYMPTALERVGNFSQSFASNGKLITVTDPTTKAPFPNNIIPADRLDPIGQAILKWYPLPNYTDPNPTLALQRNYAVDGVGSHPRRNELVRIDWNPYENLRGFFRWARDNDTVASPFVAYNFGVHPFWNPQPGHGYAASVTWIIRPSLLNETTLGKSWNSSENYPVEFNGIYRSSIGAIPQLFENKAITGSADEVRDGLLMPNISFGGSPINPPTASPNNNQHTNHNDTWDVVDNLTWVKGAHQFKTGIYINLSNKVQVSGSQWNGTFSFGTSTSNPNDSGNAFANAILGNFQTYTESTRPIAFDANFSTQEFFIQDNWRVTSSLTLDYGIRFYHLGPQYDMNFSQAGFSAAAYDPKQAPRLYYPGLNAAGQRVGVDTVTGIQVPAALIGKYVPGTGNTANGLVVGGLNGTTAGLFTVDPLTPAPRFGFAWRAPKVKGLVVRGGFGTFIDRTRQLITSGTTANAPVSYAPTVYYGNLQTLAQSAGALGPSSISGAQVISGVRMPSTSSYSLGLQKELPMGFLADAAFVGSYSRHLLNQRNINSVPVYSQFAAANQDPTTKTPLPDDFFRYYPGLGNINIYEFASNANYNALQTSLRRRFAGRFGFGASYTFSKVLGVANAYSNSVSSYFNRRYFNYGPLSFDRSQVLKINYSYDLPDPGKAIRDGGARKVTSGVLGGWTLSGVTSFSSGAPFTPTFTTTNGQNITGSTDSARITVVGDPNLPSSQQTIYKTFNTAAFVLTPVGSFGNAAAGLLRGPGLQNWDVALKKDIRLRLLETGLLQLRAEAYNVFNHTNFTTVNSAAQFNPATGAQTNANFGAYTAAAPGRILSFTLRFQF